MLKVSDPDLPEEREDVEPSKELQRERVLQLIEGLKAAPDGYVLMRNWTDSNYVDVPEEMREDYMKRASANPCGTACCIAGKAGLMPVFQDQGFKWLDYWAEPDETPFSIHPLQFFGRSLYQAVLVGQWTMDNIETTAQAIMVLEAFLAEGGIEVRLSNDWVPANEDEILALAPKEWLDEDDRFPVSRHFDEYV